MLEKLQAKPNHIKQSISLAVTIVIFSCILFVWFSSRDARSRELEVRGMTVSPVDGVGAMFDGFVSGFKERLSSQTSSVDIEKQDEEIIIPTDDFDISGVVVLDLSATTTSSAASTSSGL